MNIPLDWNSVLTLASTLVAVYSLIKMRSARQAVRMARQRLLSQLAAEYFGDMSRAALNLASFLRSSDWNRAAELATELSGKLFQAVGTWSKILDPSEKDKLQVASQRAKTLTEMIPAPGDNIEEARRQKMQSTCSFVIVVVSEVAGRLKLKYYEEEP